MGVVRDEVDDTDMTAAQLRAALDRGIQTHVVTSREEFEARSGRGGARFEVYEDRAGGFRFRLRASDGQVLATSGRYATKAEAKGGVESVQSAADSATVVDVAS